jgi:hypothetical protein
MYIHTHPPLRQRRTLPGPVPFGTQLSMVLFVCVCPWGAPRYSTADHGEDSLLPDSTAALVHVRRCAPSSAPFPPPLTHTQAFAVPKAWLGAMAMARPGVEPVERTGGSVGGLGPCIPALISPCLRPHSSSLHTRTHSCHHQARWTTGLGDVDVCTMLGAFCSAVSDAGTVSRDVRGPQQRPLPHPNLLHCPLYSPHCAHEFFCYSPVALHTPCPTSWTPCRPWSA